VSFISKLIPAFLPLLLFADTKSAAPVADAPQASAPKITPAKKVVADLPVAASAPDPSAPGDTILRAMKDEIGRSRLLNVANLDVPYYVEYALDDVQNLTVTASLGGLVSVGNSRVRLPHTRVRVGDYKFDNTNYVYSDYFSGSRYDPDALPLDDNYGVLRRALWLSTDRAFKTAVEAIARKRAALKNITQTDDLPDFWKAEPVQKILPIQRPVLDQAKWTARTRDLSSVFNNYPSVLGSAVQFSGLQSTHYMLNSEGTEIRIPDSVYFVQARAAGQAPDGMSVRDAIVFQSLDINKLPSEADIRKAVTEVAENVKALTSAPVGDVYSGPVLIEGVASAQMFAELLGGNLSVPRKPIGEPGRSVPFFASDLEGRIGSRILPEFLSVVDDPTQTAYKGTPLFGQYQIDEEGVVPKPLTIVEKGKLQTLLLTRQPVKGFDRSNGHARLPGSSGARSATFSNLFIRASETTKAEDLKKRLLEMCQKRNKPYGIIVRKMDYPSSASIDEVRRIMTGIAQSGGSSKPVSLPLLVYRIYPDGREELVRGVRFRGLSVRSLKEILAVSEETYVFHVMDNQAPFALMGAGGYITAESVVAPSILFEDLEFEKPQDDQPKLPIVPAPPLTASR
jgi:predicted Zn-dependent protease